MARGVFACRRLPATILVLNHGVQRIHGPVVCELVLVELYMLLRNPAVVARPLGAKAAAAVCRAYRRHPRWRLVENAPVMEQVWTLATGESFARRRIIDARLARTLQHHGATELATVNTRDFAGLGFTRVWNPLAD